MEAARILKASGAAAATDGARGAVVGGGAGPLRLPRLRQSALGRPHDLKPKPEHARLAAYFNLDNGTGAIRGIFGQNNDGVCPSSRPGRAAAQPGRHHGQPAQHRRHRPHGLRRGGAARLPVHPGPRRLQLADPPHHVDTYERLQPGDLMKNAVVMAAFAYHAANRAERLPRSRCPSPRRAPSPLGRRPRLPPPSGGPPRHPRPSRPAPRQNRASPREFISLARGLGMPPIISRRQSHWFGARRGQAGRRSLAQLRAAGRPGHTLAGDEVADLAGALRSHRRRSDHPGFRAVQVPAQ